MRIIIRKIIAILSATLVVGGVVIIAHSLSELELARIESDRDFLPAMQQEWSIETQTPRISSAALNAGTYIGIIEVPSLKLRVNLFEGTESEALSMGAGHYSKSVMPGESDNSVIAGHRDTVFGSLGKIKIGAPILITTQDGTFTYRVTKTRIVNKNDRTVIVPTDSATVTLSTCYPFRYVGSAPKRFVVSALMVPKIL